MILGQFFIEIRVHPRRGARLSKLFFKHFSDPRGLVVIFDLVAARLNVLVNFGDIAEALAKAVLDPAQTRW